MARKNAIEIIVTATDKASAVFSQVSTGLRWMGEKLNNFAQKNEVALFRLGTIWKDTLHALGTHIADFTEKASKTKEVEEAMGRLAKNMNMNSKDILSWIKKASKGTVSDYDLMLSANKAMSLWVAKNTSDFVTLMEIARVKSKNVEATTTQAYNDLVTGLGRWSAQILDNLGITVNAAEANEEYAKSIGKTVNQLTESEKKQAIINKVVAEGRKELQAAGDLALTDAEKRQVLIAQLENMKDKIWSALLPTVQKLLDVVTPLMEKFTQRVEANPGLASGIVQVVAGLSILAVGISSVGLAAWPLGIGLKTLSLAFSGMSWLLPMITGAFSSLWPMLTVLTWPIGWVVAALAALWVAYATNLFGFRDAVNAVAGKVRWVLQELGVYFARVFSEIWTTIKTTRDQIAPILIPIWQEFKKEIWEVMQNAVIPILKAFMVFVWETFKGVMKTLGEVILFIKNVFTGNWSGAWQNIVSIWRNALINILNTFNSAVSSIFWSIRSRLSGIWSELWEWLKWTVQSAVNWISSKLSWLTNSIQSVKNAANSVMSWAKNLGRNALSAVGFRASGGNVLAGQLYRVNELGTEYFQPAVNGRIERRTQSWSSFSVNFGSVVINNGMDLNQFEERIKSVIYKEYQNANLGYF